MPSPTQRRIIELQPSDLTPQGTVACPSHATHMPDWASHPRIYLMPDQHGLAHCPYCNHSYQLASAQPSSHHS